MHRGERCSLCVFLLPPLLLLLPPLPGVSSADAEQTTRDRAGPGWRDMQEKLREAATLCQRYWAHFSCRLWPEDCDEETERSGKTNSVGRMLVTPKPLHYPPVRLHSLGCRRDFLLSPTAGCVCSRA